MNLIKIIIYNKYVGKVLKFALQTFYKNEYLCGYYFDEKRIGYWWGIRSILYSFALRRQNCYWPVNPNTNILGGNKIVFDNSSLNCFQNSGCYFQAFEKITIGKNVWIAQNVGIITANHDLSDPDKHSHGKPVYIGNKCWIGMNSVILPGVTLGENVVVGAGSIVTKSFPEGHCVICGNPARKIRNI